MNIMIAIPATAILLTNLDFWEKIRAVCKIVAEQRTALVRSWSGDLFALLSFLSWSTVNRCRLGGSRVEKKASAAAARGDLLAPAVLFVLTACPRQGLRLGTTVSLHGRCNDDGKK